MTATNVTAIRTSLETKIAAFTPVGSAEGKGAYTVAAATWDWTARPDADIDREFTIGDIPAGQNEWLGAQTEAVISTQFEVIIGHAKTDDVSAGESRRQRDCEQISRKLEYPTNYPTGVCIIHFEGSSYQEIPQASPDGAWITKLRFALQYLGDSDGE